MFLLYYSSIFAWTCQKDRKSVTAERLSIMFNVPHLLQANDAVTSSAFLKMPLMSLEILQEATMLLCLVMP